MRRDKKWADEREVLQRHWMAAAARGLEKRPKEVDSETSFEEEETGKNDRSPSKQDEEEEEEEKQEEETEEDSSQEGSQESKRSEKRPSDSKSPWVRKMERRSEEDSRKAQNRVQ